MQLSNGFPFLLLSVFSLSSYLLVIHFYTKKKKKKKNLISLMVQKDEYQDPILTPGNLRQFVENLPGKAKVYKRCASKQLE
jgi:hypothetical protein